MKHIELSPERQEQVLSDLRSIGIDPIGLGMYLREKVGEDRNLNEVKKGVLSKEEFFDRKSTLMAIEYLSVILTKHK